jgi:hypothetical protein
MAVAAVSRKGIGGRPPVWTPEKRRDAQIRLCAELSRGRSLRSICADEDMPSTCTAQEWLAEDLEFATQYARARERQADFYADEITEIADSEADPNKARVRIDARKWVASKLKPKTYGDRLQLDGDLNVKMSDDQLDARISQLLGKTGAGAVIGGTGAAETSS